MKTYFLGDPHWDHDRILEITDRPFTTVEEHNEAVLEGINKVVTKQDRLILAGDICFSKNTAAWLKRIVCKNRALVYGNHDTKAQGRLFCSAHDVLMVDLAEHSIFVSHYPHAYWPRSHKGCLHVYGHVHAEREGTLNAAFPGRRSMDCGVDNALKLLGEARPFSEDEIIDILGSRPGHDHVEWYEAQRKARKLEARRKALLLTGTCSSPREEFQCCICERFFADALTASDQTQPRGRIFYPTVYVCRGCVEPDDLLVFDLSE